MPLDTALLSRNGREKGAERYETYTPTSTDRSGEGAGLEDPKKGLRNLEHVSKVRFDPSGNVVAVSLEESQVEQEAIERAVEDADYEVSRPSVRITFTEGPNLCHT